MNKHVAGVSDCTFLCGILKPCPHCRRKVQLSPKTARQRRNSATVALFCDKFSHFSASVWTCFKGINVNSTDKHARPSISDDGVDTLDSRLG